MTKADISTLCSYAHVRTPLQPSEENACIVHKWEKSEDPQAVHLLHGPQFLIMCTEMSQAYVSHLTGASVPITRSCSRGSSSVGDETVFWPEEEEGSEWRSRRAEHSVPAGDKREACQRPHSSELTHTTIHFTHIHMRVPTHTYLPWTLFFFFCFL